MKKQIAVFFGGASSEYEISLQSAYSVISQMNRLTYEISLIGITREGDFYLFEGAIDDIPADKWLQEDCCYPVVLSQNKSLHGILIFKNGITQKRSLDAALPVLHGKNGEDGTLQGVLELAGIPCIGCGVLCSSLCMDKGMAHRIAAAAGVKVPASRIFYSPCQEEAVLSAGEALGYPLFVKPLRAGSSFGITKVLKPEDLMHAVTEAFLHDNIVILEEMIQGFEVGCAVIGRVGSASLVTGEIDEIELSSGYFDFAEKYSLKTSNIHVPARISPEKAQEIKETALLLFQALDCDYFARIDMFLTPDGSIYFNEINTIPGFTSHSRFPNMLKAAGISFEETISRLLSMAFV